MPMIYYRRRVSTPEPDGSLWNNTTLSDFHHMPPPQGPPVCRIPSPLPEQMEQDKEAVSIDYDETPPVSRDVLIKNHLRRWVAVKKKWKDQAIKNESRYGGSKHILQAIYTK